MRLTLVNKILRKIRKLFYLNQIRLGPRFGRLRSMLSAGHKAIAIPSATALKESDLKVLENHVVHIYPDQDRAGEALYDRLVHASLKYSFTLVRHQLPPDCKDFSDLYLRSLIL